MTKLEVSKDLASTIVELVPAGAMMVNNFGQIILSNSSLNSILDESGRSLIGSNISEFLPSSVFEQHQHYIDHYFCAPEKRQMGDGKKLSARTKSGFDIPIEIGLNPIVLDGELCVLATLVDISDRIENARLFERSIKCAPHGVLIVNGEGLITFSNTSLNRSFGYSHGELIGNPIEMLLPDRYRSAHVNLRDKFWLNPTVREMGPGRDLTALHADGHEFPVEIGLSPLNEKKGTLLVTLTDITERKRMELKLRETNTNLEEFTYVASHDLRSPLRGISDLVEWIKEDLDKNCPPEVDHNLNRVSIRISRMEELIDNLLWYARAGNSSSDIDIIDINELIDNVLSVINIPQKFTVTIDIQTDCLKAPQTPIETVLRNLISNSIKHHDKDKGKINISCQNDGNMVKFSVEDDGPGIPESARSRIFRLFQTASARDRGSSGIGLAVSRRLTETHGGSIGVEDSEQGANFFFLWPRFIRSDVQK